MKIPRTFMLCACFVLLGCGVASAQETQEIKAGTAPPDLHIVKVGENSTTRYGTGADGTTYPAGEGRNDDDRQNGMPDLSSRWPTSRPGGGPGRMRRSHQFGRPVHEVSLKLSNEGAREVKAVAWTYLLADADTDADKPVVRYPFLSYKKIAPNKSATLHGVTGSQPPPNVVRVKDDKPSPLQERVDLTCVLYADGSFWSSPSAGADACEELKAGPGGSDRRRARAQ